MLNEGTLFAYWDSQKPKVDIRMRSGGDVTVFSGKDREAFSGVIAKAEGFRIGEQDWISRDQMSLLVAVK
jgi:hypothetical protein